VVNEAAMGRAALHHRPEVEKPLPHRDLALDHPIERAAVQQLVLPLRRHARNMHQLRGLHPPLLLFAQPLGLPVREVFDGVAADAELDEMQRHAAACSARKRTTTVPSPTWSPTATATASTSAAPGADSVCSIFMASSTASGWPVFTRSPSL